MAKANSPIRILVCGSSEGAQLMAGLAASRPNTEVRVLALENDRAAQWVESLKDADICVRFPRTDGSKFTEKGRPTEIASKAEESVSEADVVILASPATAFEQYLAAIKDHLRRGTVVVGVPGRAGFEFQCRACLGELADACTVVNLEKLPWECRVDRFGEEIDVTRTDRSLLASTSLGNSPPRRGPLSTIQYLFGAQPLVKSVRHYIVILLSPTSALFPCIFYGRWRDWKGTPLESEPFFFRDVDECTSERLLACSQESLRVAEAISREAPHVATAEFQEICAWLKHFEADIGDTKTLLSSLRTNRIWGDVKHPMKKLDTGQFEPNFDNSYLNEDVPFGLLVVRGLAEIVEVQTPKMDEVLLWCQAKSGKSYIVDGKISGSDVNLTACPQRFGLNSLDAVFPKKQ